MASPTVPPSTSEPMSPRGAAFASLTPPTLRAVCLDIDDTLVDFTSAGRAALAAVLGRADRWDLWERVTESHVEQVVNGEMDYAGMHHRRTACFLAELGIAAEYADVTAFERRRCARAEAAWTLFADVVPCLEWLAAAGVRIAAVTNASGAHQRRKLAELGIAGYFDHVAVAGELGVRKPEVEMFDLVCRELGCSPSEAAHIGDKLRTDACGARDAGLLGVWLARWDETGAAAATGPRAAEHGVHVLTGLEHLPELLVGEYVRVGTSV